MNEKKLLKEVIDNSIIEWFKLTSNQELNKVRENLQVIKSNLPLFEKSIDFDGELRKTETQFGAIQTVADIKFLVSKPEMSLETMMLGDMSKLMENMFSNMFNSFNKGVNSVLNIKTILDEKIGLEEPFDQIDPKDIEYLCFVELKKIHEKLKELISSDANDCENVYSEYEQMVNSTDLDFIMQKNEMIQRYYLKLKPNHVMENMMIGGTDEMQKEILAFQNVVNITGEIELFIKLFKIIKAKI
ncbi:hypothetical protein [Williamsoniiplasma luminosum]|uniref:Uncharacterized protein n=1 Tax=Williamsoniiplasma luminosum TaxID=214888 RepID=A0A2S0NJG6_9MOLU|nr:hypothetical protein [Williamsoniiplasma luminosum]AVP49145.1 MAG: hypothetical protein C5T88_00920 [Williamsoniiplasma luminosum]